MGAICESNREKLVPAPDSNEADEVSLLHE